MISLESIIKDDTFENEYLDEEDNINNYKKIINDVYDEYEYEFEYNKMKNIYYRKNPFSESSEKKLTKPKFRKFMKLPGIDDLNPKNFLNFTEKGIYDINDIDQTNIKNLLESIEKNNIINIYGKKLVYNLADELSKYYYLTGKFQRGIYILFPQNIEEELDSLKENIILNEKNENNNNEILIIIKSLIMEIKEDDIKMAVESLGKIKGMKLIICSETEFKFEDTKNFHFKY